MADPPSLERLAGGAREQSVRAAARLPGRLRDAAPHLADGRPGMAGAAAAGRRHEAVRGRRRRGVHRPAAPEPALRADRGACRPAPTSGSARTYKTRGGGFSYRPRRDRTDSRSRRGRRRGQAGRRRRTGRLGVGVAVGLSGFAFGVTSAGSGLTLMQTCALSLLVFTGASQFALVGRSRPAATRPPPRRAPSSWACATPSTGCGCRSCWPSPRAVRPFAAQWVIDETTAVALAQPTRRSVRIGFTVTGLTLYLLWNLTTLLGALGAEATRGTPTPGARRRRPRRLPSAARADAEDHHRARGRRPGRPPGTRSAARAARRCARPGGRAGGTGRPGGRGDVAEVLC